MIKGERHALISTGEVEKLMLKIRGKDVLLDRDVAMLYGVETRDINKAVKNNPRKFPQGYILGITEDEKTRLVENFHRFNSLKHSTSLPKAFSEKGLYMLATILKSPRAITATLAIIETFAMTSQYHETDVGSVTSVSWQPLRQTLRQEA